jgi:hypothetical protein
MFSSMLWAEYSLGYLIRLLYKLEICFLCCQTEACYKLKEICFSFYTF